MTVNPDDALVNELRRIIAAVDSPPDSVTDAARAAFLLRDVDGDLAVLVADSRADDFEPIRSSPDPGQGGWLLSFEGGGVRIDMEIAEYAGRLTLIGQFTGAGGDDYVLETGVAQQSLPVDRLGRFLVDEVDHGRIRLRCRSAGGTPVTTTWVTI